MYEERQANGAILFKKDDTEKAVDNIQLVIADLQKQISSLKSRCTKLENALKEKK